VDEFGSTFFKGGLEKVDNLAPPFLKVDWKSWIIWLHLF